MRYPLKNNQKSKHYSIEKLIGKGGTSLIYRAMDTNTELIYLLKEFYPYTYGNEITRNKDSIIKPNNLFEFEYNNMKNEFVKQIDRHKNLKNSGNAHVLSLKEYFEENNTYYIVYEYADGTPLNQLLEENNSPYNDIRKILKMIRRLIETLEPLHKENYLHLDISPDNIFIDNTLRDDKPEVKIIDYGNVIHINELDEFVANLLYKEHYSAPELIDSIFHEKNESIGFHSDIYSITSVLFQMLFGRPLFFLDEIALTISDFNENQYFQKFTNEVKRDCLRIIKKGIASKIENRYLNLKTFKKEIDDLLIKCQPKKFDYFHCPKRPPQFFERKNELQQLKDHFKNPHNSNWFHIFGDLDVGKTALCIEYSNQNKDFYDSIIYIPFSKNIEITLSQMQYKNEKHELCPAMPKQASFMVSDFINQLNNTREKILLIIDNVNTYALKGVEKDNSKAGLRSIIQETNSNIHVIITSIKKEYRKNNLLLSPLNLSKIIDTFELRQKDKYTLKERCSSISQVLIVKKMLDSKLLNLSDLHQYQYKGRDFMHFLFNQLKNQQLTLYAALQYFYIFKTSNLELDFLKMEPWVENTLGILENYGFLTIENNCENVVSISLNSLFRFNYYCDYDLLKNSDYKNQIIKTFVCNNHSFIKLSCWDAWVDFLTYVYNCNDAEIRNVITAIFPNYTYDCLSRINTFLKQIHLHNLDLDENETKKIRNEAKKHSYLMNAKGLTSLCYSHIQRIMNEDM